MSTAVLMSDTWKPTVIQLVPFANNKMRTSTRKDKPYTNQSKPETEKRSFPVLAVTRVSSGNSLQDRSSPRVNKSHQQRPSTDTDVSGGVVFSGGTYSNSMDRKGSDGGEKRQQNCYDSNNNSLNDEDYATMINMNEMNVQLVGSPVVCSNGGLNGDQSRRASANSTDARGSGMSPSISPSSHRILPKPSIGSARYFLNQQGKGLKKPTPGEMELQKYKDRYSKEQAQKKKKYKLNVNQLPRSTTPINEHDPDRLNMKQVIQFLQNQKIPMKPNSPHVQLNKTSETKMYLDTSRTSRIVVQHPPVNSARYEQQLFEKVVMHENMNSKSNQRGSAVSRMSNTTAISTKSSPVITQSSDKSLSVGPKNYSCGAKSMIERSHRVKRSEKRAKEFKLYRFLAVVPGNETKMSPVVFSAAESTPEKKEFSPRRDKMRKTIVIPKEEPEPEVKYRTSLVRDYSESGIECDVDYLTDMRSDRVKVPRTANVVHRKARKHQLRSEREELHERSSDSDMDQDTRRSSNNSATIRLPNVNDFPLDELYSDTEHDDDSVILRAVFNVNNNNNNSNVAFRHQPEPETRTQHMSVDHHTNMLYALNPSFKVAGRIHKNNKQLPIGNGTSLKKLMINIPGEHTDHQSTEVIKLTLRKEKNGTRETSYMTDMAGKQSLGMINNAEAYGEGFDKSAIRISTVSMQQRARKDQEDENPSNSMANSCIKVRQKLKANLYSE